MQNAATLYHQAFTLQRDGQFHQAEALYRQVLQLQPNHADALHMLGVGYYQSNKIEDAIVCIEKALAINPRHLNYLNNHGLVLCAANQPEAALKSFQKAILLQPKDLDCQLNIANTLLDLARYEEAAGYYRRVLRVFSKRDDIRAALCHCLSSLGNQAHAAGKYVQAEACFQEAVTFSPQDPIFHYNLANALRELGKPAKAAKHYEKSIQLNPNDADAYNNLGNVQRELGQLDLAIANYKKALTLNPQLHHAKVHLVHQKQHICDWSNLSDDIAEIRSLVATEPNAQISPFAFLAMPTTTADEQKQCANNWVKNRYTELIKLGKQLNFKYHNAHQKLRIGYLSSDFRLHPLAFLISELIELHGRSQFEVYAYSFGVNDKTSARARLEKAFDKFHDIRHLSEIEAAQLIHRDEIDILVDLTGFTQTSRSGIAALRPAPINVNWLGFPGSMGSFDGAPLFDYILTDKFITPPDSKNHYAEALLTLPNSYQPNDRKRPIGKIPSRSDCQLPDDAFVFCSFNQSFKITPEVFEIWMRLLKAKPHSVLWLLECNQWAKANLTKEAEKRGVDGKRLIFAPRVAIADHLARHAHADLFLDTLPYNAHTTCSDALFMGIPVVTCVGDTFAARVAGSLLHAADLPELITYNLQDYENKALKLANNASKLTQIKEKLIAERMTSRLFDTTSFAKSLESCYHAIYKQIC